MTIRFQISLEDALAYERFMLIDKGAKKDWKRKRIFNEAIWLFVVGFVFTTLGLLLKSSGGMTFMGIWFVICSISLVIYRRLTVDKWMLNIRKKYLTQPDRKYWFEPCEMIFMDDCIKANYSQQGFYWDWELVTAIGDYPDFFSIYFPGSTYFIIPKNKLTSVETEGLRLLLQKHVPAKQDKNQN